MENKELKKPMPNELDEDALDNVSAGIEVGDEELVTINVWDYDIIRHPDPSEENVV